MDELKAGDVCRLLPNPTTGASGKVYFSASVTRVRLGLQSSDGWRVVALDGVTERGPNEAILYGAGLTQWVAARFLVPLEIDNDEAADGDEMKAVLVGTGIEYELSVAQVIANLEEHRATLAEAHALLIGQAVDAQIHAANLRTRRRGATGRWQPRTTTWGSSGRSAPRPCWWTVTPMTTGSSNFRSRYGPGSLTPPPLFQLGKGGAVSSQVDRVT